MRVTADDFRGGGVTHTLGLWLDNDRGLFDRVQELAEQSVEQFGSSKEAAARGLSDYLKDLVEEMRPEETKLGGFFSDLITHALLSVDFDYLAEIYIDNIWPESHEEEPVEE